MAKKNTPSKDDNKPSQKKPTPEEMKILKEKKITEYQKTLSEATHPNNNFIKNTKI